MPTRARLRALAAQRIGSYQLVTVSLPPDVNESTAQRVILSTDLFDADRPASSFSDAWVWSGRFNEGRRVKRSSYRSTGYAFLTSPTSALGADEAFTLTFYGFGTTGSITLAGSAATRAAAIETAITGISGLESYTVSEITTTTFKITMSSLVTVEISNENGSITSGIGSIEATRPWRSGLPLGSDAEIHHKLPAHDGDGFVGWNSLLNQAIARLSFIDRLQFTPTDTDTTVFEIDEPWLTTRQQIIQAYLPATRSYAVNYTPPGSGSFTLTFDLGFATAATTTQLYSVTASALQTAIRAAQTTAGHAANATVALGGGIFSIAIPETMYATPSLTADTGTVGTEAIERTANQYRYDGWRLIYDGERRFIEIDTTFAAGESWELEVYRPCHTWIASQVDYQTEGDSWSSSTVGFSADLDRCEGDEDAIVAVAHYLACRQMANQGPSADVKYWQAEAARAAGIAANIKLFDVQRNVEKAPRDSMLTWERGRASKGFFS